MASKTMPTASPNPSIETAEEVRDTSSTLRPRRPRRTARGPGNAHGTTGSTASPVARPASKIGKVQSLLRRDEGATLDEMVAATGWLPHTTRAALTGLRKKGHAIEKDKRDGVTCYRIMEGG